MSKDGDHKEGRPKYDDPENAALAAHLRAERARKGLKQSELAKRSGLSVNTISRLETQEREMSVTQVLAIARGLGIDAGDFVDAAQRNMRDAGE
ncbi:helix-turn-helix transcriptional regulator [Nocardia cyriacigeorgica]|uniref:helix-turn-helix domain-containing protein n=1 Tax=Nocardia cyriacigeorgica TaxID=135487 RepID=UPI0018936828|nr:helix-turn-helix transcriptional regulator [Nocardia cyriacigeorgica]MBF6399742.1 helix-turn-helix transcriptional regulator [Nocardia cyriacigeorgica]MBF6405429.1 helix-turn-helix transcriptional regulator [Nocardia cyriacigeorgica]